jgi:hypothetical protein
MWLVRGIVISFVLLAACSSSQAKSTATDDEPASYVSPNAPDGWWVKWDKALAGKTPFGVGTRFEFETLGAHGIRQTRVIEVRAIKPSGRNAFQVELASTDGSVFRTYMPPGLKYTPGKIGFITARNEKLVSVTVPAGTFAAGRLWTRETVGGLPYEEDEWVVPEIPIPVQRWSRPGAAKELYNPPADGTVPPGTTLDRLIRIDRR